MPVSLKTTKKQGKTVFQVVDPKGKVLGEAKSRKKAVAQLQAINLSMLRKKGRKGLPPALKKPKKKRTKKKHK